MDSGWRRDAAARPEWLVAATSLAKRSVRCSALGLHFTWPYGVRLVRRIHSPLDFSLASNAPSSPMACTNHVGLTHRRGWACESPASPSTSGVPPMASLHRAALPRTSCGDTFRVDEDRHPTTTHPEPARCVVFLTIRGPPVGHSRVPLLRQAPIAHTPSPYFHGHSLAKPVVAITWPSWAIAMGVAHYPTLACLLVGLPPRVGAQ